MNLKRYLKVKMLNLQQEVQLLLSMGDSLSPNSLDSISADIDDLTNQITDLRKSVEGKSEEPSIDEKPAKTKEKDEVDEIENISLEELLNQLVQESAADFAKDRVEDFELLKKKQKQ